MTIEPTLTTLLHTTQPPQPSQTTTGFDLLFANAENRRNTPDNSQQQPNRRQTRQDTPQSTNQPRAERPERPTRERPEQPNRPTRVNRQEQPENTPQESNENLTIPLEQELPTEPVQNPETLEVQETLEPTQEPIIETLEIPLVTEEAQEEDIPPTQTETTIITTLAEAAQLPPAEMQEILTELEIQPTELTQPPEVHKLLQHLLNAEPADLLTTPNYSETVKEIIETVTEIAKNPEITPNLDLLRGLISDVDEDDNLIISAEETEEPDLLMQAVQNFNPSNSNNSDSNANTNSQQEPQQAPQPTPIMAEIPTILPETPQMQVQQTTQTTQSTGEVITTTTTQTATTTHTTVQTTPIPRANPTQIMEQILSRIKTAGPGEMSELRMTLRPADLGDVTLRIMTHNGAVIAMFVAESQRIKEIIEENFSQLREALKEQGISIADLYVSVDSGNAEEQMNQYLKARQEALRRLQRASGNLEPQEEVEAPVINIDESTVDFLA
ncbi:MAG: flagellar hook-length control protein FliK [Turicibacter sp.]|nr:flagellar hook-length control protein FliK [Turicibacter sp.]